METINDFRKICLRRHTQQLNLVNYKQLDPHYQPPNYNHFVYYNPGCNTSNFLFLLKDFTIQQNKKRLVAPIIRHTKYWLKDLFKVQRLHKFQTNIFPPQKNRKKDFINRKYLISHYSLVNFGQCSIHGKCLLASLVDWKLNLNYDIDCYGNTNQYSVRPYFIKFSRIPLISPLRKHTMTAIRPPCTTGKSNCPGAIKKNFVLTNFSLKAIFFHQLDT